MCAALTDIMAELGIESWGVCRTGDLPPLLRCRAITRMPSGAQSVIVCLFPYPVGDAPRNVARYAAVRDYHFVAGGVLAAIADRLPSVYPEAESAAFVDNSPIPEVAAARLAGLGVVGRNGLLLHPRYGSRMFIGAVVTTARLAPGSPQEGGCRDCGHCFAACPTGALRPGAPFERALCRSHITQKKGALTDWEKVQIRTGGLAWGCDLCQDACPINSAGPYTPLDAFSHGCEPLLTEDNLDALLPVMAYGYRGREVLRRNLRLLAE